MPWFPSPEAPGGEGVGREEEGGWRCGLHKQEEEERREEVDDGDGERGRGERRKGVQRANPRGDMKQKARAG